MAVSQDMAVLEKRWMALDQVLSIHDDWFGAVPNPSPRLHILQCLIKRLQAFAKPHFYYFYEGFNLGGTLQSFELYPPKHVLSTILYQIADDLDVYRRAAADEMIADDRLTQAALRKADRLVLEALKPAAGLELENPNAITYFQRSAAIRVIPYDLDEMAVIGIPFTCTSLPQDFLAIPHEVGHFVFWNGKVKGTPLWILLRQAVMGSGAPRWIMAWLEEIFADVYGGLVAGPSIALDFQDLQLTESAERFIRDDGEHPAPAVRPDVYAATLDKAGLDAWNGRLRVRWRDQVNAQFPRPARLGQILLQRPPLSGFFSGIGQGMIDLFGWSRVSVAEARRAEEAMVSICYEFLQGLDFQTNWWGEFAYGEAAPMAERTGDPAKLFDIFTDYVDDLQPFDDERYPIASECQAEGIWEKWRAGVMPVNEVMIPPGSSANTALNLPWLPIWIADGWATKGPHARWP
ncbi:MAG: hypothetical protein ACE5EY_05515 [Anaerolineae bacterium]